jgi:hypothetical protein
MENANEIRIGNFDYSMPFLLSLFDGIRNERSTFASYMLKMWEDSQPVHGETVQVDSRAPEVNRTALERQVENEENLLRKDD